MARDKGRDNVTSGVTGLVGELALLQAHAENAEVMIEKMKERIGQAHEDLALEQAQCQRSGDTEGYQRAVAEEGALNAAYQRLETAIGRMHFPAEASGSGS